MIPAATVIERPRTPAKKPLQSSVATLGEQAHSILHRLLDQQEEAPAIARAIRRETGERITERAITRYAALYRKREEKRQQLRKGMDGFLALLRQDGIEVSDLLRSILVERLDAAREDGTAAKLDLLKLEEAERKRGEYELKLRQAHYSNRYREWELNLKEKKHLLAEKEFQLKRDTALANVQELERKAQTGQSLSREDIRRIREIYGLYDDPPQPQRNHREATHAAKG